jgi:hypothetical protein
VSTLDHTLKPEGVHRLEMITGTGRRRRFSALPKAVWIEEERKNVGPAGLGHTSGLTP